MPWNEFQLVTMSVTAITVSYRWPSTLGRHDTRKMAVGIVVNSCCTAGLGCTRSLSRMISKVGTRLTLS